MADGFLAHRPRWPRKTEHLERIQEIFLLHCQHKTRETIRYEYNLAHPDKEISISTVDRCVARARAILIGSYAKNLQQLAEISMARRYAIVQEGWAEIDRIENSSTINRKEKTEAKDRMMKRIEENYRSIEEMLGVRSQPEAVVNESRTLVVITGDEPAQRIQAMAKLVETKIPEPKLIIDMENRL